MSSPPQTPVLPDPHHAAGVRFRVLARVFPVLRHEVLRPIANASLAAAMLRHVPENPPEYVQEDPSEHLQKHPPSTDQAGAARRQDALIDELESMLAEGASDVRRLGDWLEDTGDTTQLSDVLPLCKKLVFTQLLRSGKQIHLAGSYPDTALSLFAARYVLLAWMLYLLDQLPDGGELRIEAIDGHTLRACGSSGVRAPASAYPTGITADESIAIATLHGWQMQRDAAGWILRLPVTGQG